jgi:hypothetical protein
MAAYNAEGNSPATRFLDLADGEQRNDITLKMIRPAVISGTVFDSDGDPVPGAQVVALAEGYPRGKRELQVRSGAMSDERGDYRISGLALGRYYLAAIPRGTAMTTGDIDASPAGQVPVRQYYGGGMDPRRATPVLLRSGEQLRGIDFRLASAAPGVVRGHVTGLPEYESKAPPMLTVMLGNLTDHNTLGESAPPPDYRFQFSNVPPGRYEVAANIEVGKRIYWAARTIDVPGDNEDVTLALAPVIDLHGRVTLEGAPAEPIKQFHIELVPGEDRSFWAGIPSATTGPDGKFTIENVRPGIWDIGVAPIPRGGYLKSMSLGKQDVLTEEMEIRSDTDAPLNIVVSTRGAVVNGEVGAGRDRPVTILLAPVGRYARVMSFFKTAATDAEGKFELTGITPGDYRIFAFEPPSAGFNPANPELVAQFADSGEALRIAEGDHLTAHPKIITAEQLQKALP